MDLVPGRLLGLFNPIELDGRVAWYPEAVRGYASVNCYLAIEGSDAVLVDTGVTVHREALISQLRSAVPEAPLNVAFTRIGEYPAICNATAIAERMPVEAFYAAPPGALDWVEFRPRAERPPGGPAWAHGSPPESRVATKEEGVPVGAGGRRLHLMSTPVRLLPSHWLFDDGTGTLFTGDVFSHAWRPGPDGPWILDEEAEGNDQAAVREHLLTRCWWLAEAERQGEVQRALEEVFDRFSVESIAPGYGCVIQGRREVERHYEMLQAAIGSAAERTPA